MGLVIYAYHLAAVGVCGSLWNTSLKERLAGLLGKTCCSESNYCFFLSHDQPQ